MEPSTAATAVATTTTSHDDSEMEEYHDCSDDLEEFFKGRRCSGVVFAILRALMACPCLDMLFSIKEGKDAALKTVVGRSISEFARLFTEPAPPGKEEKHRIQLAEQANALEKSLTMYSAMTHHGYGQPPPLTADFAMKLIVALVDDAQNPWTNLLTTIFAARWIWTVKCFVCKKRNPMDHIGAVWTNGIVSSNGKILRGKKDKTILSDQAVPCGMDITCCNKTRKNPFCVQTMVKLPSILTVTFSAESQSPGHRIPQKFTAKEWTTHQKIRYSMFAQVNKRTSDGRFSVSHPSEAAQGLPVLGFYVKQVFQG
jgi:hypothetical protein